jgi:Tol biopolymer transport system component
VENYPSWSPDGITLAYHSDQNGNWDIWLTQIGSGQQLNRTADHTGIDHYPSWSPDGTQIAFLSQREGLPYGVFVMPTRTGTPHEVAAVAAWFGPPLWSKDGTKLAYPVKEGQETFMEIHSIRTRDSQRILLPGKSWYRFDLSWSPDERLVAYLDTTATYSEITRLLVLNISKGEAFAVTDGRTNVWSPRWSPDGRSLFFVSNRGGSMDLWRQSMSMDGKPTGEPLPLSTGLVVRNAAFSADGRKLAYTRGRRVANLWRVPILEDRPATWADAEQLTSDQALIEYVDISPDSQRLVFSSDRNGNQDLWTMPADGGEMQQLTTDPTPDWNPMWSPDGGKVAFYSYRSGNRDVWIIPISAGQARQVTQHERADIYPSWSPDGRELVFRSDRSGNGDIWITPTEGGEARQITDHPGDDLYPAWSPDGKWIVFSSDRTGSSQLWRVPTNGGDPEEISQIAGRLPRYSLDGNHIFFIGARQRLWDLPIDDGTERPLFDPSGRIGSLGPLALATDGEHLYFAWQEDIGDIWVTDVIYE